MIYSNVWRQLRQRSIHDYRSPSFLLLHWTHWSCQINQVTNDDCSNGYQLALATLSSSTLLYFIHFLKASSLTLKPSALNHQRNQPLIPVDTPGFTLQSAYSWTDNDRRSGWFTNVHKSDKWSREPTQRRRRRRSPSHSFNGKLWVGKCFSPSLLILEL